MDYPAFRPGSGEGVDPILRSLREPPGPAGPVSLRVRGFERKPEGVEVLVDASAGDSPLGRWRVLVADCVDFDSMEAPAHSVCVLRKHPILWRHQRPEMEMHVVGTVANLAGAMVALVAAHDGAVLDACMGVGQRWIHMEHFTGPRQAVEALLRDGGGRIARGPERLLERYAKALDLAGARTTLMSLPGRWARRKDRPKDLKVLFVGESYAIGTSLHCREG
jgi:hypothetical protein